MCPVIDAQPVPPTDTRTAQMWRAGRFMSTKPDGSTLQELQAACDLGSSSKVLSDMSRAGFGIAKSWRLVSCAGGKHRRRVRVYVLTSWPDHGQLDLFKTE